VAGGADDDGDECEYECEFVYVSRAKPRLSAIDVIQQTWISIWFKR
jgi:hypothetical protein